MKRSYHRSRETQQKLLDAVIQLTKEKRYESITVQDVCRVAGVSTGSFYHQFGSKDDMVLVASQKIDWLLTQPFLDSVQDLPPLTALDHLLRRYVCYVQDEIGPVLSQYYHVLLDHPDAARRDMDRAYGQKILALISQAIEQGDLPQDLEASYLANLIMRQIRGLFLDWLVKGGAYSLLDAYEKDFQMFLRLARATP